MNDGRYISVILPAYNAERFLAKAIESILDQTYRRFELILIDDGSTDRTGEIMERYRRLDSRIVYFSHANAGKAESVNRGVARARHDWIAIMDADDVALPRRLERQVAFLDANPDVAIVSALVAHINAQGKVLAVSTADLTGREEFRRRLRENEAIGVAMPCALFAKKAFVETGGLRGRFWPADDIDFWNRAAEKGFTILVSPEVLLHYRIHETSAITSRYFHSREQYDWVKECMLARRAGRAEPTREEFLAARQARPLYWRANKLRKDFAKYLYRSGGFDYANGRPARAGAKVLASFALQPGYSIPRVARQLGGKLWRRTR